MARRKEIAVTNIVVNKDTVEISKQVVGKGCSSEVLKATVRLQDGKKEDVAAKRMLNQGMSVILARNEVDALKRLQHPNIIKYFGTLDGLNNLDTYIIMEIAQNGDLYHYIKDVSKGPVPISKRWRWILESAWAIQYLHSEGLVHKDIKSQNFFIMEDNTLKLGDFGLAEEHIQTCSTRGNGTYNWMAKEVLLEEQRSTKSDVYSYGAVVWEMQAGEIPLKGWRRRDIFIGWYEGTLALPIKSSWPPLIKNILRGCLEEDHTKRFSMDDVFAIIDDDIIKTLVS